MRLPVAQGFYPKDPVRCKKMVEDFLDVDVSADSVNGGVVPHAGYAYSGEVAGHVYKALKGQEAERIVIFGTNHTGKGMPLALSTDTWQTSLGEARVDVDFVNKILGDTLKVDEMSHMYEHSIEVQLPFLQVCFPDLKIVPVSVSRVPFEVLSKVSKKFVDQNSLYIASSDFTHYGSNYGFTRDVKNPLKFVEKTDKSLIELVESMEAEKFYEESQDTTVCGAGGICLMMLVLKELGVEKGRLLKYDTSFSKTKDKGSIVGYAGMVL